MATIGFIGLGNMGGPMAANLVKAQHHVTGFDLSPSALSRRFADNGGHAAASTAEAAGARCDIVVTMLPAGPQVRAVYLGPDGVIARAKQGALLIDCSTIDVDTARAVAAEAARGRAADDRRAGFGRHDRRRGRHPDLHGRRRGRRLCARRADPAKRWAARSSMPARRAPGRPPKSATT